MARSLLERSLPDRWRTPLEFWRAYLKGGIEPELFHLRRWADRMAVAVDIGANSGLYSYQLARWFRQVEAFEPNPRMAACLRRYCCSKIRIHEVALSGCPGVAPLNIPISSRGVEYAGWGTMDRDGLSWADDVRVDTVALATLDSLELEQIAVIKIDVEGHECEVLTGGRKTITHWKPVILIEVKPPSRCFVDNFFKQHNYKLFTLSGQVLKPLVQDWTLDLSLPENIFALPAEDA